MVLTTIVIPSAANMPRAAAAPAPAPSVGSRLATAYWPKNGNFGLATRVDGRGKRYVLIESAFGAHVYHLQCVNTSDTTVWDKEVDLDAAGTPEIECDQEGNTYLCGSTGSSGEFAVIKYDPDGKVVWRKDLGGYADQIPAKISLDNKAANLFFCANYGNFARIVRLAASNGSDTVVVDTARAVTNASKQCRIYDISAEASGCLYAVGHVDGQLVQSERTSEQYGEYAVIKYDYDGQMQWAQQSYNADGFTRDLAAPVACRVVADRATGIPYVLVNQYPVGLQWASVGSQWWLMKFSPVRGRISYVQQLSKSSGTRAKLGSDFVDPDSADMAIDRGGNAYMVVDDVDKILPNGTYTVAAKLKVLGYGSYEETKVSDARFTVEDVSAAPGRVFITGTTCDPLEGPVGTNANAPYGAYSASYLAADVDSDGDALPDSWEIYGYTDPKTGGFVDLPKMGADPLHKDVFVEVDRMATLDPKPGVFDAVIKAFADADEVTNPDGKTGINLHVDAGAETTMNASGAKWGSFSGSNHLAWQANLNVNETVQPDNKFAGDDAAAIKGTADKPVNMKPERFPIFHYCVWANKYNNSGSSGIAAGIPAADFVITLGAWRDHGTFQAQAGTFMHELGHTLGLHHGGQDEINYKPNYLSIMNYSFQLAGLGKSVGATDTWGFLDYSRFGSADLSTVCEGSLNESVGITSPNGNPALADYRTIFYRPDDSPVPTAAIGPKDWNTSRSIEGTISPRNINKDGDLREVRTEHDTFVAFEDWTKIKFNGGGIGGNGVMTAPPITDPYADHVYTPPASPYGVSITAPANAGLTLGQSLSSTFKITNTGTNDDTYTVETSSSAGWASFAAVPSVVGIKAGDQATFEVSVTVPGDAVIGENDEISISARSVEHELVHDSGTTIVAASKNASIAVETVDASTSYGGISGYTLGEDGAIYRLPYGWIPSAVGRYDPKTKSWSDLPMQSAHFIYPAVGTYVHQPYGRVRDVSGGRFVYQLSDDIRYPKNFYLGVYDFNESTETFASMPTTHTVALAAVSGNTVVYVDRRNLNDWPWTEDKLYAWDLTSGTQRLLGQTDLATGVDPWFTGIDGDHIALPNFTASRGVDVQDVHTGASTHIAAPNLTGCPRIGGHYVVWWEGMSLPVPELHLYDLNSGSNQVIATDTTGGQAYLAGLNTDGRRVIYTLGNTTRDVMVYEIATGQTVTVAKGVQSFNNASDWSDALSPQIQGDVATWTYLTPSNSYGLSCAVLPSGSVAPSTSASIAPAAPAADGWYSTTPTVTLAVDQPNALTYYQYDATATAGWIAYDGPFSVRDGDHTVYYYSADRIGNKETPKTLAVKADTTPPQTSVEMTGGVITVGTGIYHESPQITLTPNEPGTSYYQWDGSDAAGWQSYDSTLTAADGEHTLWTYTVDAHGNAEEPTSRTITVDSTPDSIAPSVIVTAAPSAGADGIFRSRPRVDLSADETATIYYQWDSTDGLGSEPAMPLMVKRAYAPGEMPEYYGGSVWSTYLGSLYSSEGTHTLYYYGVDVAGNRSEIGSVTINVQLPPPAENVAPILAPIGDKTAAEGTRLSFQLSATDANGDDISYSAEGLPPGASLEASTGLFTWTPGYDQARTWYVTFSASDGQLSRTRTITITVTDTNRPPVAPGPSVTTTAGVPVRIHLTASDPDGDKITWLLASSPADGTLLGSPPDLTYVPDAGFLGTDEFAFTAMDGRGGSAVAHVMVTVVPPPKTTVTPTEGADRYGTAVAVSQEAFPNGAPCVILATGLNWPDATGGATLAAAKGGPVLLTPKDKLPTEVLKEIRRLRAKKAIVLGSDVAVGRVVFGALEHELGKGDVSRIGGKDRYETAQLIAKEAVRSLGRPFDGTCFLATGGNFPDALSASPLAASKGWPVLLAGPAGLSASTLKTMRDIGVKKALELGDTSVMPRAVDAALKGKTIVHLAGKTRYDTAKRVAEYGVSDAGLHWDEVAIATGADFPDALVGGVLQAKHLSVMLLTPGTYLHAAPKAALTANKAQIHNVRFLGSLKAITAKVREEVAAALK